MEKTEKNEKKRQMREILPDRGIWTVQDLATYLDQPASTVQQKLSDLGINVLNFSRLYRQKLFRLEELRKENKE